MLQLGRKSASESDAVFLKTAVFVIIIVRLPTDRIYIVLTVALTDKWV